MPPLPAAGSGHSRLHREFSLSPDKGSGKIQLTTDGAAAAAQARGSPSLGPHPAADRGVPVGRGVLGVDVGPDRSSPRWRDPALVSLKGSRPGVPPVSVRCAGWGGTEGVRTPPYRDGQRGGHGQHTLSSGQPGSCSPAGMWREPCCGLCPRCRGRVRFGGAGGVPWPRCGQPVSWHLGATTTAQGKSCRVPWDFHPDKGGGCMAGCPADAVRRVCGRGPPVSLPSLSRGRSTFALAPSAAEGPLSALGTCGGSRCLSEGWGLPPRPRSGRVGRGVPGATP